MQDAAFSSLFGALSTEHRMDFLANNLANAGTAGYKQDNLAFKDTMIQFAHDRILEPLATIRSKPLFPAPQIAARPRIAVAETDFSQGPMQFTGNPLDLAIAGDGFFRVQSPFGTYLTRNGSFCQTADGQITTKQGWPVLGQGGPLAIPPGTRNVHVSADGRLFADNEEVGAFQLVTADNLNALKKVGGSLYRLEEGSNAEEVDAFARAAALAAQNGEAVPRSLVINQGFVEASNVNVVTEMVKMIETQRQFEAYQKVIQTSDSIDREATTKVGKTYR